MGVDGLPSRITGFLAISIIEEITFMPACQGSSNSSQCGLSLGEDCLLILKRTGLESAISVTRQFTRSYAPTYREHGQQRTERCSEIAARSPIPSSPPSRDILIRPLFPGNDRYARFQSVRYCGLLPAGPHMEHWIYRRETRHMRVRSNRRSRSACCRDYNRETHRFPCY